MYVSQYLKIATFVPFCDAAPHIVFLQDYMKQFDAICLTETKCDRISDNEINGFK